MAPNDTLRRKQDHSLATMLAKLPDAALVPVGWIRKQLIDTRLAVPADTPDLTVAGFARLVGRSKATVRMWCARGVIHGAYKLPGDRRRGAWRIPAASVVAFRERLALPRACSVAIAADPEPTGDTDITAWRTVRARSRRAA